MVWENASSFPLLAHNATPESAEEWKQNVSEEENVLEQQWEQLTGNIKCQGTFKCKC